MNKLTFVFQLLSVHIYAQVVNTPTIDSTDNVARKIVVEGYVDSYYAYNFNEPANRDQPYLVSMARHNEFNINLAYIGLKYSASRVRARVVPGFGTYVNANYSREDASLRNLIEANAGVRLFKNHNVWLDAGILSSPYANEGPISKDHLAYTRSLAAENVPYYLAGAKLSMPLTDKLNVNLFVVNGWQQIRDENSNKSFGSQLEFRPNKTWLLNWNTFVGKENALKDSTAGRRYFSDFFLTYDKDRISLTSCIYYGIQKNEQDSFAWWQGNIITQIVVTKQLSTTIRFEYFDDSHGILVLPITGNNHFETFGVSLGANLKVDQNILFRVEGRQLIAKDPIFLDNNSPTKSSFALTGSLCAWF